MELIKKVLNTPLSVQQVLKMLDNKANFFTYPEIYKHKDINTILGKHKVCILLYLTSLNFGHFTCLFEYNNSIHFFDSYGYFPDDELKFVPSGLKQTFLGYHKYLLYLLSKSNKKIYYNEYNLQSFRKNIETCGYWVIYRIRCKHLTEREFYNIFKNIKNVYIRNYTVVDYVKNNK